MKKVLAVLLACMLVAGMTIGVSAGEGGEAKTLKVGVALNETGWFSSFDLNGLYEVQTYADILNERGGVEIGGEMYQIEIIDADGQSDPSAFDGALMSLVDAGVDIVLTTNDFWVSNSVDILEMAGIPYIDAIADFDPHYFTGHDLAFGGGNGAPNDNLALIDQCRQFYPDAKTMLFVINDDGLQDVKYQYVKDVAPEYGFEVLDDYVVYSPDATDMSSFVPQIVALDPDVIIGQGVIANICNLYKACQDQGMTDLICLGSCGKPASVFINILGEEYAKNVICPGQSLEKEPNTEEWGILYDALVEKYGEETAANWTGNFVNMLLEAIGIFQQAGSVCDGPTFKETWLNADSVEVLYGTAHFGGQETYGLDGNRVCILPTPISTCKDGVGEFIGWFDYSDKIK